MIRRLALTGLLAAVISALFFSGGGAFTGDRLAVASAVQSVAVVAPAGINGEAPPPAGFRYSNRFETKGPPGFPTATEQCLGFGRTLQEENMINDFYCWDTAPGTFSELWVTP